MATSDVAVGADDVVQEAMLTFLDRTRTLDIRNDFGFVSKLMRDIVLDVRRRSLRRAKAVACYADEFLSRQMTDPGPRLQVSPAADSALRKAFRGRLQREILLAVRTGDSFAAIAEAFGVLETEVRRVASRMAQRMRSRVVKDGDEASESLSEIP